MIPQCQEWYKLVLNTRSLTHSNNAVYMYVTTVSFQQVFNMPNLTYNMYCNILVRFILPVHEIVITA